MDAGRTRIHQLEGLATRFVAKLIPYKNDWQVLLETKDNRSGYFGVSLQTYQNNLSHKLWTDYCLL
jgi:hypothetical protein